MLDGLFVGPAVQAVAEALVSSHADAAQETVAVVGHAKLAQALAKKQTVLAVGLTERAAKKFPGALADLASIATGSIAAVIGVDVASDDDWEAALREWTRVVRDGGASIFVDRGHAPEASRRALCSGLTELEQRRSGRLVVTSGLVSHLT